MSDSPRLKWHNAEDYTAKRGKSKAGKFLAEPVLVSDKDRADLQKM